MKKPLFAKLRRNIADKILGNQTVLFTSKRNIDLIEAGDYLSLPDEVLAASTRRWFMAIEEAHVRRAKREQKPVTAMVAQHAVLALASYVNRVKAETAEFTVRGSVDGGQTEKVYRVQFSVHDDYDFGEPGVSREFAPGDPEKLTKLTLTFDNRDYDAWKARRAQEREAA